MTRPHEASCALLSPYVNSEDILLGIWRGGFDVAVFLGVQLPNPFFFYH